LQHALFLDRDGVINVDYGYVYRQQDFHFINGIFDLVKSANQLGYLVCVVTNQAGIGRGYYTEKEFELLTQWMLEEFRVHGAKIDGVYHCPFHHECGIGRYKATSKNRKPEPGMLLQAAAHHSINLPESLIVGDKESDLQAGENAGLETLVAYKFRPQIPSAISVDSLNQVISLL
jgi:D-glycero-D-manno-heptose 1,7-bisphosphate phosphatase